MAWFKIDDSFWGHPKRLAAPASAIGLWVTAGSWCAQQLTDGAVPRHVLGTLGGRARDASDLVRVGLWEVADGGWLFHDWAEYQPSRAQVHEARAAAADRQRRGRERARQMRSGSKPSRRDGDDSSHRDDPVSSDVTQAVVTQQSPRESRVSRPDPTGPDPKGEVMTTSSHAPARRVPDAFDEFWSVYPRKDDKLRARKAWASASRATDPREIVAGAVRYRDDPNRDASYTKQGATWLNAGSWSNGPLPQRGGGRPTTQHQVSGALALAQQFRDSEQPALEGPS